MAESLRTDLNDFLFTTIADDPNGPHVTMLSVLARTGVDPWMEAAGLAALSRENATQKLVLLLAGVPNGPAPGDDTANLVARLVAQLHASPKPRVKPGTPSAADIPSENSPLPSFAALPRFLRLAIYSLAVLILMALSYRALASGAAAAPADQGHQRSQ